MSIIKKYKSLSKQLETLRFKRKNLLTNNTIIRHNLFSTKRSLNKCYNKNHLYKRNKYSVSYIKSMEEDINKYKKALNNNIDLITINKSDIKIIKDELSKLGI